MHSHVQKPAVLTREINNIIYELLVKTHSDMVYVGDKVTLTERLCEFADLITRDKEIVDDIKSEYDRMIEGSPENFRTFKEIWDYLNINGDPKSELIQLIDSKVDKVEGYGLSECDFTQVLKAIVENDYTPEQIDEKFRLVGEEIVEIQETLNVSLNELSERVLQLENMNNIYIGRRRPSQTKVGDIWYRIKAEDNIATYVDPNYNPIANDEDDDDDSGLGVDDDF